MPEHTAHVHPHPDGQEHEERQPTEQMQQPQMMDSRVVQHLLREDVLQRKADRRDERTNQSDHVERDLSQCGNGDARYDGHQTQVDDGRLALAQNHTRKDDGEEWHRGFNYNEECKLKNKIFFSP